jgi:hypothetical protein
VAVHAGREVLSEADSNSVLIIGDPQGIYSQQLRPRPVYLLNIFILLMTH